MTKRNPVVIALLSFVTFTLYAYYWLYETTVELQEETGRDDLTPILDVILAALTLGVWGVYAAYRNARIVHEELELRGEEHTDRSLAVAGCGAATLFSGWAWLSGMAILQDDFNRLAATVSAPAELPAPPGRPTLPAGGSPPSSPSPETGEALASPSLETGEALTRGPAFHSSAPMPVVF